MSLRPGSVLDLLWNSILAAGLMFGIYLLTFGCIILAPVYAVRQSFLSYNLLKQTYFYLASNVFNMNVDLETSKESDEQLDNRSSWWQGIKQKLLNVVSVIVAAKREFLDPVPIIGSPEGGCVGTV